MWQIIGWFFVFINAVGAAYNLGLGVFKILQPGLANPLIVALNFAAALLATITAIIIAMVLIAGLLTDKE
jgi:hypothetical protein